VKHLSWAFVLSSLVLSCGGSALRDLAQETCNDLENAIVLQVGLILENAIEEAERLGYTGPELGDAMRDECPNVMAALANVGEEDEARARQEAEMNARVHTKVDKCNQEGAAGTVTNSWTDSVDVTIEVQFTRDGILLDTGLAFINGLKPKQTAQWEALYFGDTAIDRCAPPMTSVREAL